MCLQLSILPTFAITILQKKTIGYQIQCSVLGIFFPLSSTRCLNLIIPNFTPGAYFRGGLYIGRIFPFQKLVPKRPVAYTWWAYYRNFTVD